MRRFQPIEGDRVCIVFRAKFSEGNVYPRTGQEGPEGEYKYSSTLSLTSTLYAGGLSTPCPGRYVPGNRMYRMLGGPHGQSGRVRKNSPPTGVRFPDRPARKE